MTDKPGKMRITSDGRVFTTRVWIDDVELTAAMGASVLIRAEVDFDASRGVSVARLTFDNVESDVTVTNGEDNALPAEEDLRRTLLAAAATLGMSRNALDNLRLMDTEQMESYFTALLS